MVEVRASFATPEEWDAILAELGDFTAARQAIIADVRRFGLVEPITGARRHAHEITIRDENLLESLNSHGLNSRKRGLLARIDIELRRRGLSGDLSLRVLCIDALSQVSLLLRSTFPYCTGIETGWADDPSRFFPIPTMKLERLAFPDAAFDLITAVEALENVTHVERVFGELHRVLKPGGLFIAAFPFSLQRPAAPGPEPMARGFAIVADLLERGWSDVFLTTIASSQLGVVAEGRPGPLMITAQKEGPAETAVGRPPKVMVRGGLPDKLCLILALPRSGTTLLTALFAVHSKVVALYEPWNAKRIAIDQDADIAQLSTAENLPDLQGKVLFVKETAARPAYVDRMRSLYETTPYPVDRALMLLLRRPEATYLSEVARRAEWWNDTVEVGPSSFAAWCEKSRGTLRKMLSFARAANACVMTLEDLAARPEPVLRQLCDRIGLTFERQQLEYQDHLDRKKVRGDLNVGASPQPIDVTMTERAGGGVAAIDAMLADSSHAEWFAAFRELHRHVAERGGIVAARDIPRPLMAPLVEG
jgi:SAM-dependent methyltransferase